MKAARILKEKINSGQPTLGVMATFHFWPLLVEVTKRAGLDYLLIDMEHLTHNHEAVGEACAIGRMIDFPVLVRPPDTELTTVRLAMDLGPCGLLVPCIENVGMLDVVRDAVYMKPRGKRRPGGLGNYWVSDYNYPTWVREVEDDFIILPQIERKEGLSNVGAIAAHPLTTAMAVGPYDLSADLGVCWDPEHPALTEALDRIRAAATAAGKTTWMIGDACALRAQGFTFLCISEIVMLLEGELRGLADKVRNARKASGDASVPLP